MSRNPAILLSPESKPDEAAPVAVLQFPSRTLQLLTFNENLKEMLAPNKSVKLS